MRQHWLIITLFLGITSCTTAQEIADQAYFNGKIYTANTNNDFAQAIAIKAGKIIYVGNDEGVDAFIGEHTEFLDLDGALMLPGIHDVHVHALEASASSWGECILDDNESDAENYLDVLFDCNLQVNSNGWLVASGHSLFPLLEATRSPAEMLDELFPNQPIVILEKNSHSVWVNSKGLEKIGFDENTPDPIGGHILKDAFSGKPNGILLDNAGDEVLEQTFKQNCFE